ncbi:hypothetical protein FRIGORI9N_350092 [Frigoribacterium sp. 9N]|nr:hypothetical protein FRIGORI9N_350092 [Frigoribacterium sp. 9N]
MPQRDGAQVAELVGETEPRRGRQAVGAQGVGPQRDHDLLVDGGEPGDDVPGVLAVAAAQFDQGGELVVGLGAQHLEAPAGAAELGPGASPPARSCFGHADEPTREASCGSRGRGPRLLPSALLPSALLPSALWAGRQPVAFRHAGLPRLRRLPVAGARGASAGPAGTQEARTRHGALGGPRGQARAGGGRAGGGGPRDRGRERRRGARVGPRPEGRPALPLPAP